jgi:RHS repeat-associated protein
MTSGAVSYVYLDQLDQPIGLLTGDTTRVVQYTWRGLAEGTVFIDGTPGDCSIFTTGCLRVRWPAATQGAVYYTPNLLDSNQSPSTNDRWFGTLLANGQGTTGQVFRRNRFFDPASGQFTQEDPIGLGGGLNLWGIAGGDPVNYSDLFGLCPVPADKDGTICLAFFIQAETALGLAGDAREFSSNSDPSQSRVWLHIDPSAQTFSAHVNPSCTAGGRCQAPLASNRIGVTFGSGGGFTVSVNAKNSILPGPAINGSVTFTPNGRGGFTTSGNRDAFPSTEAYLWRGGEATTLFQRGEASPFHLLPPFPNDRWPQ